MKDFINKHLTAIIAAAFALIVVIVLAVVLIGGNNEKKPGTTPGTENVTETETEGTEDVTDVIETTENVESTESTESTEVVTPEPPASEDTGTSETPTPQPSETPEPTPQPEPTPEPEPAPQPQPTPEPEPTPEPDNGNVENGDTNIPDDTGTTMVNGFVIETDEAYEHNKQLAEAGLYNPVWDAETNRYFMLIKGTDNWIEWSMWLDNYVIERGGTPGAGGGNIAGVSLDGEKLQQIYVFVE